MLDCCMCVLGVLCLCLLVFFFFCKQKTAYEMRISDWSSTCALPISGSARLVRDEQFGPVVPVLCYAELADAITRINASEHRLGSSVWSSDPYRAYLVATRIESATVRSEEHTSELQSLMRISYAVFCLKKKIEEVEY